MPSIARCFAVAVALFTANHASGQEKVDLADRQVQAFIKQCEAATRDEIAELPAKIKASEVLLQIVKRGAINPQLTEEKYIGTGATAKVAFPSSERKKAAEESAKFILDAKRLRLKNLKAGDALSMAFLSHDSLKVGDIGRPEYGFNVNQVVDDANVIVKFIGETDLWLKGFDTKGLTDDAQIKSVDCVRITGTKQYTTVTGAARTILLAEPFDGDAVIRAHIAAQKVPKPMAKPLPMKPAK